MTQPTQYDVNQVQTGNRFGWNGNRANKQNRNYSNFLNSEFHQEGVSNTHGLVMNQPGYHQYPPMTKPMPDSTVIMGQPRSFTHPTWNRPSSYIPVETPNIFEGVGRRPLHCYRCRQIWHYASECLNPRASDDYAPICGNCKQSGHTYQQCNAPFNYNNRDHPIQVLLRTVYPVWDLNQWQNPMRSQLRRLQLGSKQFWSLHSFEKCPTHWKILSRAGIPKKPWLLFQFRVQGRRISYLTE